MAEKQTDLGRLRSLKIGDVECWPVSKLANIRAMCGNYSKQWGTKYKTRTDADNIYVTRLS